MRYYRTLPLSKDEVLVNVNAQVGAVVEVPKSSSIQLFVPPRSFEVWDLFDTNLASTSGIDVVLCVDPFHALSMLPVPPCEHRSHYNGDDENGDEEKGDDDENVGWAVVSPFVSLSPTVVDAFQIPWTLRLPHNAAQVHDFDNGGPLTVLQQMEDVFHVKTLHVVPGRQYR